VLIGNTTMSKASVEKTAEGVTDLERGGRCAYLSCLGYGTFDSWKMCKRTEWEILSLQTHIAASARAAYSCPSGRIFGSD